MKILNIILREKFDLNKLSALPKIAWEIAQRAQEEININIISNGPKREIKKFNKKINFIYLPGSYISFFDNVLSFIKEKNNQGIIYFLGSLSGGCIFSWRSRTYPNKIILNLINGGISAADFKFIRLYDFLLEPSNCIFHPSVMGKPAELLFSKFLQNGNIAGIIVQSQRLKNKILSLAPKAKVEQIPFGVQQKFLDLKIKKLLEEKLLLYFGHVYSVRGIDDMLISIDSLLKEGLKIKTKLIITPETNVKFLEKILSQFPKVKENTFLIKKYINNLGKNICGSDLAFFLYRFSGEIPEYPLALLETMAAGIPVITTNIGAITELFPKNIAHYCLVKPGDIKNTVKKAKSLLSNIKLRNLVIKTNKDTVAEMTWEKYYDKVKKYF
jgi:glycosyltransferase involved in cell wall biosynthesis